ncbi:MAG: peptidase [Verrucomicrobia bacterium]|nr:peptidase [Verrucomicrobiota bacterium]
MPSSSTRALAALLLLAAASFLPSALRGDAPAGAVTPQPVPAAPPAKPATSTVADPNDPKTARVENSVVKVFATMRYPDLTKPWTKQAPGEATGTGIVIEGNRILTNAHVVLYASQVQVQANQAGDKLSATVVAFAPGIDLAVLKLDDETFFETHPPLPRANALPEIKDSVLAYGFPTGGNSLSITKGIISRIEFMPYNFPVAGLRIQIDAAINPGNSGGPALVGDKMIGVTFSHLGNADNIGYIIPTEEVELFLADVATGSYHGKPAMFDDLQTLENDALRAFLRLDKTTQGIVVHEPFRDDADYPLKKWDVITKIGDTPVDDQGMIKLGSNLRVRFQYLVQKIVANGKIPLTVIRAGKEVKIQLPVPTDRPMLMLDLKGTYPSYFVFGPLVFSSATMQYSGAFAGNAGLMNMLSFIHSPLVTRRSDRPAFEGEQLVIVSSPFFPHKLSKGYGNPMSQVVKSVNGIPIRNLNHLVEVLRDSKDEFIVFEFDNRGGETPVLPRKDTLAATEDILNDNGVRAQGSPDTLTVWNTKPPAK